MFSAKRLFKLADFLGCKSFVRYANIATMDCQLAACLSMVASLEEAKLYIFTKSKWPI